MPDSGIYFGLGFGANSTQFKNQKLEATGTSTVTNTATGALVSKGTAGGPPVGIGMDTVNSISPALQAGYFEKLQGTNYLWGLKFSYNYLGGTYYLDKSWFLDFSYTYSVTQDKTANYYSTYNNPGSPNTYSGSLIGSSTGTATVQSASLSLNRVF